MIHWRASDRLSYLNFSAPTVRQANHALDSLCSWYSEKLPVVVLSWHTCLVLSYHSRPLLVLHHYAITATTENTMVVQHSHWVLHHILLILPRTQMLEQSTSFFWTHEVMLTASRGCCHADGWYLEMIFAQAARAHCIMKLVRCSVAL